MGERGREPQELEKDSSVVEEPVAERRVLLCNGKKKFVFMSSGCRRGVTADGDVRPNRGPG